MCVPCAAPAFELLPLLGWIILGVLVAVGMIVMYLCRALPYIGLALGLVVLAAWRFLTGAVLSKGWRTSDEEWWDTFGPERGPRVTRPVKAVARLALVGALVGYFLNPWAVVIAAGSLSLVGSGLAVYGRRDKIRAAITRAPTAEVAGPIRVKARIGRE